jgi:hypothetical protein
MTSEETRLNREALELPPELVSREALRAFLGFHPV